MKTTAYSLRCAHWSTPGHEHITLASCAKVEDAAFLPGNGLTASAPLPMSALQSGLRTLVIISGYRSCRPGRVGFKARGPHGQGPLSCQPPRIPAGTTLASCTKVVSA
jgi:hypothetical protein